MVCFYDEATQFWQFLDEFEGTKCKYVEEKGHGGHLIGLFVLHGEICHSVYTEMVKNLRSIQHDVEIRIFLSTTFYVESILENLEDQKLMFLAISMG